MFSDQPAEIWAKMLDGADIPHDYNITFGAFVLTLLSLILPFELANGFMSFLCYKLLTQSDADFIIVKYAPDLHDAI